MQAGLRQPGCRLASCLSVNNGRITRVKRQRKIASVTKKMAASSYNNLPINEDEMDEVARQASKQAENISMESGKKRRVSQAAAIGLSKNLGNQMSALA